MKRSLFHTHVELTHTISDHAEDPEYADTRQQIIMNTVHLSLFPPHEIVRTLSHSHPQKEHKGSTQVPGEYEEAECDSAVEGSEMKTGKAVRVGAYSSNVRKPFCMSSSSCAYSAFILASPSFTGSLNFMELIL